MKKSEQEKLNSVIKTIRHGIGDIRKELISGPETDTFLNSSRQSVADFRKILKDNFDKMPVKARKGNAGEEAEEEIATLDDAIKYFDDIVDEYSQNADNEWLMDNLEEIAVMLEDMLMEF